MSQTYKCGIYLIINQRNNLKYVGQSKNIEKRIREHFSGCFKNKALIDHAISCEPQNFSWQILKECEESELNYYEQYYIYYLDSMNNGYNRTFGGDTPFYACLYSEQHHATYYTNEEMLNIRKEYVQHTIEELYGIYNKGQGFYVFKNQVLNSFRNLPKYNKLEKRWHYPTNWADHSLDNITRSSPYGLSQDKIMQIRRLSVSLTIDEIIKKYGLGCFKSKRHMYEVISGKLYTWLPYFSRNVQKWIYPKNWQGKREQEVNNENWMNFFLQKEKANGKRLSNYQVMQIRFLNSQNYNIPQIMKILNIESVCSADAIRLITHNKTYLKLPYFSKTNGWILPSNLNEIQKENFPLLLEKIKEDLKDKVIIE